MVRDAYTIKVDSIRDRVDVLIFGKGKGRFFDFEDTSLLERDLAQVTKPYYNIFVTIRPEAELQSPTALFACFLALRTKFDDGAPNVSLYRGNVVVDNYFRLEFGRFVGSDDRFRLVDV